MEPLIAALVDGDGDVRQAAAGALGKIGDPQAVEPLIATLDARSKSMRQDAAQALVGMYRSAKLNDAHKRLILAQRNTITEGHNDRDIHSDYEPNSDCHRDSSSHDDSGIGIDFPI